MDMTCQEIERQFEAIGKACSLLQWTRGRLFQEAERALGTTDTAQAIAAFANTCLFYNPRSDNVIGIQNLDPMTGLVVAVAGMVETTDLKITTAAQNLSDAAKEQDWQTLTNVIETVLGDIRLLRLIRGWE